MSRDDLHFRLRIPDDLKSRVEKAAKSNKRSMTAEIVAALEEVYPAPEITDEDRLRAAGRLLDEARVIFASVLFAETQEQRQELAEKFKAIQAQYRDLLPGEPMRFDFRTPTAGKDQAP